MRKRPSERRRKELCRKLIKQYTRRVLHKDRRFTVKNIPIGEITNEVH